MMMMMMNKKNEEKKRRASERAIERIGFWMCRSLRINALKPWPVPRNFFRLYSLD